MVDAKDCIPSTLFGAIKRNIRDSLRYPVLVRSGRNSKGYDMTQSVELPHYSHTRTRYLDTTHSSRHSLLTSYCAVLLGENAPIGFAERSSQHDSQKKAEGGGGSTQIGRTATVHLAAAALDSTSRIDLSKIPLETNGISV